MGLRKLNNLAHKNMNGLSGESSRPFAKMCKQSAGHRTLTFKNTINPACKYNRKDLKKITNFNTLTDVFYSKC